MLKIVCLASLLLLHCVTATFVALLQMLALPGLCVSLSQELSQQHAECLCNHCHRQGLVKLGCPVEQWCSNCLAAQTSLIPIVARSTALLAFMVSNIDEQLHGQARTQC